MLTLRRAALTAAKYLGCFWLARYLTRDGLRILCYHGISIAQEHRFRGTLFISPDVFRRRMECLKAAGYPILPLPTALDLLQSGLLPPCATVVTVDDGWRGVYLHGARILAELNFPVMIYVASYYVVNQVPVYSVTAGFLFWRSTKSRVDLPRGLGSFDLNRERLAGQRAAIEYGLQLQASERVSFLRELAATLEVSFEDIEQDRLFHLMTAEELRSIAKAGFDVQLHTYHHQWSIDEPATNRREIELNREHLASLVDAPLEHFCFPSGICSPTDEDVLSESAIKSAATVNPGLNYSDTPRFALNRILDGENTSQIEFEAEMSGLIEIVRCCRTKQLRTLIRRRFFGGQRRGGAAFFRPTGINMIDMSLLFGTMLLSG